MRASKQHLLIRALDRRGIPEHVKWDIVNEVFAPQHEARARVKDELTWDSLIHEVQSSIANLTSNRSRWPAHMVPLYEEYRQVMHDTKANITAIRHTLLPNPDDPTGPKIPATLPLVRALAARRNEKLKSAGAALMPACTDHWPSWVNPQTVQDLINRFEQAYDANGGGRGKRLIPFATTSVTKANTKAIIRHRSFIEAQREAILAADPDADRDNGRVHQPYGALHLCALRQAELWLDAYERDIKKRLRHPATHPVPVNWTHMLTHDLRARLRDADAYPKGVTPEGLGSFLIA